MKKQKGFTLVEILIATGILACMTAVLLALLNSAVKRLETIRANIHLELSLANIKKGQLVYYIEATKSNCEVKQSDFFSYNLISLECQGPRNKLLATKVSNLKILDYALRKL